MTTGIRSVLARTGRWLTFIGAVTLLLALAGPSSAFAAGEWSAPQLVDPTFQATSVSCPLDSFCIAVDSAGEAWRYNGSSWSGPLQIDPGHQLEAVSCPSSSFVPPSIPRGMD